jgi:hypothetical protein
MVESLLAKRKIRRIANADDIERVKAAGIMALNSSP